MNLSLWVNTTDISSKDSHLVLRLKWNQTRDTLRSPATRSVSSVSHQHPSLWLIHGFYLTHTCSRGPLKGSRSADYLLTASRTMYNIPDWLFCSPTLICLNKPGLILSQKHQVTIWTSEGKTDILPLIRTKVKASNVHTVDKCALGQYQSCTRLKLDFVSNKMIFQEGKDVTAQSKRTEQKKNFLILDVWCIVTVRTESKQLCSLVPDKKLKKQITTLTLQIYSFIT